VAHLASIQRLALGLVLAALPACGASGDDGGADCAGGKCDVPDGPDEELCALRRADAFDPNQQAFRPDFLRWSCRDVEGVTAGDRGQEYCEYFAIVQLPPALYGEEPPPPAVIARNLGPDHSHGTTPSRVELSFDQLSALEDDERAIVGQCVFTSWNSDVPGPVPACDVIIGQDSGAATCPTVLGVPVTEEDFRMYFEVNSYEAAKLLVEDCATGEPVPGDPDDAKDARHDDFTRGCLLNAELNDTAFRKSDSFVCAATMRVSECGCALADEGDLAEAIAGPTRRGFPLGTWSSPTALPVGCRYVDLGDGSQTVVTCELSAAEIIDYGFDLKGHCQTKYGDNVVVHVPMPAAEAVRCDPATSGSPYTDTCGPTPWVLQ
jgi:hypothetical protein